MKTSFAQALARLPGAATGLDRADLRPASPVPCHGPQGGQA